MRGHLALLRFLIRHKWYVFWACMELRVPIWIALLHDWTKFTPVEWFAHVHTFFESDGTPRAVLRRSDGSYNVVRVSPELSKAWLQHQRNKHHWQAWLAIGDSGDLCAVPMPDVYVKEMVADFIGASKANRSLLTPKQWFEKNEHNMILSPDTRARVKDLLEIFG